MDPLSTYLQIPRAYCQWLGGLRWSYAQDAIEYEDVGTFAFRGEVALFLQGFTQVRPLINFGHVLHLLHLLGYGKLAPPPEAGPLRNAYKESGRIARNAGVLCGLLCPATPRIPEAIDVAELCRRLGSDSSIPLLQLSWYVSSFSHLPDAPAMDAQATLPPMSYAPAPAEPSQGMAAFEASVLEELAHFRPNDLRHWLRHGCGYNPDAGERIAREVTEVKPRTLGGVLADLAQNPRLTGALPFVAQMVSALSLPPRRLDAQELPIGGYADVATRGQPERILPSQFAMDPLEFIRRFAANELLYFRREEPHVQTREQLVILLDQGVRTWGIVRHILGAAALALGKLAERKGLPLLLAATSSQGRLLDPLEANSHELNNLIEASDLSHDPGLALESVLEAPVEENRDIILLTHRRGLVEPDVANAARRANKSTRLFAVGADEHGCVQVSQYRHGTPIKLAQIQLDLSGGLKPTITPPPVADNPLAAWRGDVEPIPFPFRFGVSYKLDESLFDFDFAGEWLLALGKNGILNASRIGTLTTEALPRPFWGNALLAKIEALFGVAGGFFVAGRIGSSLVGAHYDFVSRWCRGYAISPVTPPWAWRCFYLREYHSVVTRIDDETIVTNLASCESLPYAPDQVAAHRALRGHLEAHDGGMSRPRLYMVTAKEGRHLGKGQSLELDEHTGTVALHGVHPPWRAFIPLADGRPALKGCSGVRAMQCGNTLAASFFQRGQSKDLTLRVFRGPDGTPIREFHDLGSAGNFALSRDGKLLALPHRSNTAIHVHDLSRPALPIHTTPRGHYHQQLAVQLGHGWLTVEIGKQLHRLHWASGVLAHAVNPANMSQTQSLFQGRKLQQHRTISQASYDPKRFLQGIGGPITVLVDAFGQLILFDVDRRLLCMFYIFRKQFAAWMPDGTRLGQAAFSGGPETPGAREKIGSVLYAAWLRGMERKA